MDDQTGYFIRLVLLGLVMVGTVYSVLTDNRVAAWISLPGLVLGVASSVLLPGSLTLSGSLLGVAVGVGFAAIVSLFGGLRGDEVTLMGAVGAVVGYPVIVTILVYSAMIGLGMGVAVLLWNHRPFPRKQIPPPDPEAPAAEGDTTRPRLPVSLAIVAGCLVALLQIAGPG